MTETLYGKVAIITGASSGIGEATAEALSGAGAKVALAARRTDRIVALADNQREQRTALAIQTDVSDEEQCRTLVDRTKEELGGVDLLINNAGVMLLGPVAGADTEHWRRMIDVNLQAQITRPPHVAINEVLVRPTRQQR